jgi:hypothetical protein
MVHLAVGFTSQNQFAVFPICDMSICEGEEEMETATSSNTAA